MLHLGFLQQDLPRYLPELFLLESSSGFLSAISFLQKFFLGLFQEFFEGFLTGSLKATAGIVSEIHL